MSRKDDCIPEERVPFPYNVESFFPIGSKMPKELKNWIVEPEWNGPSTNIYLLGGIRLEIHGDDKTANFPEFRDGLELMASKHRTVLSARTVFRFADQFSTNTKGEREIVEDRVNAKPKDITAEYTAWGRCSLIVNDIYYLDDVDMRQRSIEQRRNALEKLFQEFPSLKHYEIELTIAEGEKQLRMMETLREFGFRQAILKRKGSTLQNSERKSPWRKVDLKLTPQVGSLQQQQ